MDYDGVLKDFDESGDDNNDSNNSTKRLTEKMKMFIEF